MTTIYSKASRATDELRLLLVQSNNDDNDQRKRKEKEVKVKQGWEKAVKGVVRLLGPYHCT